MEEQRTQQYTQLHENNFKLNKKTASTILYNKDIQKNIQDQLSCYNHKYYQCTSLNALKLNVLSPKKNHHPEREYKSSSSVIEKEQQQLQYTIARNSKIIWPILNPKPMKDFVKKREVNNIYSLKKNKNNQSSSNNNNNNNNNKTFQGNQNYFCEYSEYCCCENRKSFNKKLSRSSLSSTTTSSSSSSVANEKAAATASSTATTTTQTKSKENTNNDLMTETTASSSRARNNNNNNNNHNNNNYNNKNIRNLNHNNNTQNHNHNNNNNQNHSSRNINKQKKSWRNRYTNRNYEPSKSQNQQHQPPQQNYQEQQKLFQNEANSLSNNQNNHNKTNQHHQNNNNNHSHKNKNNFKEKNNSATNQTSSGNNKNTYESKANTPTGNNNISVITTATTTTTVSAEIPLNTDQKLNIQSSIKGHATKAETQNSAGTKTTDLNVTEVDSATCVLPELVVDFEPIVIPKKEIISDNVHVEPTSTTTITTTSESTTIATSQHVTSTTATTSSSTAAEPITSIPKCISTATITLITTTTSSTSSSTTTTTTAVATKSTGTTTTSTAAATAVNLTEIRNSVIKNTIARTESVATSTPFSDIIHSNSSDDKFTLPNCNPSASTYTLDFLHSVGVQITGSTTVPRMRALPYSTYGMDFGYDSVFNTQMSRGNSYCNYVNFNGNVNIENYNMHSGGGNSNGGGGSGSGSSMNNNNNYRKFFRDVPTGMPNYAYNITGNNPQRYPYHQYQQMPYHQQSSLPMSTSTLPQKDVGANNANNNNNNSNFVNLGGTSVVSMNTLNDERQNELPGLVDNNVVKNQNYEMMQHQQQQQQQLHGRINHNTNFFQPPHAAQCKQPQQQHHQNATSSSKHSQNSQSNNSYRNFVCYDNNNTHEKYMNGNGIAVGENRSNTATGVQRNVTQNRNNGLQTQSHYNQNTPIHNQSERLGGGKSNGSNSSLASTISQTSGGGSFRKAHHQQQHQRHSQQYTRQSHQHQYHNGSNNINNNNNNNNNHNNNNNNAIYGSLGNRNNFHHQQQQQQNMSSHHNNHQSQQQQQQVSNQNFNNLTYVNTRNDPETHKKLKSETVLGINTKLNTIASIPLPLMHSKELSKKDKRDNKNCIMNKTSTSSYNMMQDTSGQWHNQQQKNNGATRSLNDNNNNNNNNNNKKAVRSSSASSVVSSVKIEPICLGIQNETTKNLLKKCEIDTYNNNNNNNINNNNITSSQLEGNHNNNFNHQFSQTDDISERELALIQNASIQIKSPAFGLSSGASSTASISPRCDDNPCMHLSFHSSSSSSSSITEDNILKHTIFRGRSKRHHNNNHNNNNESTTVDGKKTQHTQTFDTELQQMLYLRSISSNSLVYHDMFGHTPPDRFLARAHLIEVKTPHADLLNNSRWDILSQGVWDKFISSQQTEGTFKKKMRLWRDLYILIKNKYPRYGLYLVGSTISGFGADASDVDMCLVSRASTFVDARTEALLNLNTLRDCLIMSGNFESFNLIEAKVPILRFRDCHNKLEVDLNYNNSVGIKNTHLLYCYSQLDWRLRPLVLVIKLWAQYHNINNAKNMTISSYSLVLMVIHYLQYAVSPPVLPCLHALFPEKFSPWRLNDGGHVDMNESMIGAFESQNKQPIGELFLNFLKYYSLFDYGQSAISIRTGGLLPIQTCRLAKSIKNDAHQWKELCIEEPFDLTNTARSVYDFETFERVKTVFMTSWRILNNSLNINDIFSPNTLPPIISLNENERNIICTGIVEGVDNDIMPTDNSQRNEGTSKPNSPMGSQTDIKFDSDIITSVIEPSGSVVNILRWDSNNNHSKNNAIEKTNTIKTIINYKNPIT